MGLEALKVVSEPKNDDFHPIDPLKYIYFQQIFLTWT